jgi:PAS domain S-box-containing protein
MKYGQPCSGGGLYTGCLFYPVDFCPIHLYNWRTSPGANVTGKPSVQPELPVNVRWNILIIEDSDESAEQLVRAIQRSGDEVSYTRVATGEALEAALDRSAWNVILASDAVPALDVPGVLACVADRQLDLPVIVVSDAVDETYLVSLLAAGVVDYVKGDRLARLPPVIVRAVRETLARREYRRLEETLRQVDSNYRMLMEQTTDGISIADEQGHYREVNAAATDLLGYSRDELLSMNVTDLIAPDELAETPVHYDALRNGQIVLSQRRLRRKDGRLIIAETSARMLSNGQILAITRDITQRKQAELQLQRYSRELAESNEELKRFAYIVSHDLRAPLVNLKGFAAELRAALDIVHAAVDPRVIQLAEPPRAAVQAALHEDIPEALDFINASVTRMDHFINALLKLSRLGRAELNLERVNMTAVVRETLETLAHRIEEQQAKVTVGPLPEVIADRTAMEQIMSNILNNAVLYLEPARPGEIEIGGDRDQDVTIFHVRDNGRGIASHDLDKVFAPFRRAGVQDVPGEGMGLAYVQTLVRRHGGHISCDSELGVGTTFIFTIANHLTAGNEHA